MQEHCSGNEKAEQRYHSVAAPRTFGALDIAEPLRSASVSHIHLLVSGRHRWADGMAPALEALNLQKLKALLGLLHLPFDHSLRHRFPSHSRGHCQRLMQTSTLISAVSGVRELLRELGLGS